MSIYFIKIKEYLEERLKKIINDTNSKCPTDIIHKEQFFEIKLKDLSKTNEKEYNENVKLCDLEWYGISFKIFILISYNV